MTLDEAQLNWDNQLPYENEYCDDCEELEEECTCRHIDWEDRFQAQETY